MKNLKAIIGYGCAGLLSILTLAWYALDYAVLKAAGQSAGIKSLYWLLGQDTTGAGDLATSKIMAIIALVCACLLAVTCVLGLLNELGVLKIKWIKYVNYAVAGLFVLFALLALIFCATYCADLNKGAPSGQGIFVGAAYIVTLVMSIVALAGVLVATLGKKKA